MVVRGQSPIVKDFELVVKVASPLSCAPSFPRSVFSFTHSFVYVGMCHVVQNGM